MLTLTTLLLLFVAALAPEEPRAELDRAGKLRAAGKFAQAEAVYESIVEASPESAEAWFFLGYVRHGAGDFAGAIEAGQRAAEFPSFRATALYNVACAQSLSGQLDASAASLEAALEAGFRDLDLLESDTDLAALRADRSLPGPEVHEFQYRRAPNGVTVPYFIQQPQDHDPARSYPALLVFSPGSGTRSADWVIEEFFGAPEARAGWLVVHVTPPARGWHTHPTHHALEDVLRRIRKSHKVEGNAFHFVGVMGGGSPALTYSRMSARYAASLTLLCSAPWTGQDDSDWPRWRGLDVHLIEGERGLTLDRARAAYAKLLEHGVRAHLTVVPEGDARVSQLRGAELHRALAAVLPPAERAAD